MQDHYLQRMLGEHEQVILVTRKHWFVLFQAIVFEIFVTAVIVVGVSIIQFVLLRDSPGIPAWLGYFLVIIPIVSLIRDVLAWSNHTFIVTNRRVIQISGMFNKNVIELVSGEGKRRQNGPIVHRPSVQFWRCRNPDRFRAGSQPLPQDRQSCAIQNSHA